MTHHDLVLGQGPLGRAITTHLLDQGRAVTTVSRHAPTTTPRLGITHLSLDVRDTAGLTAAARGAETIYHSVAPSYQDWTSVLPAVNDSVITAARTSGALLCAVGNLYGYGPGASPMHESTPLRATDPKGALRIHLWEQMLTAHERGEIRAVEVRGSDYVGPDSGDQAHGGRRLLDPLLQGKPLRPIGSADQPHTWTFLPDFAASLVAAATTEKAWGHAWHAPSPEPITYRDLADRLARALDTPEPRFSVLAPRAMSLIGIFSPVVRELRTIAYQFTEPFVMDSQISQAALGVAPTSWERIVTAIAADARA